MRLFGAAIGVCLTVAATSCGGGGGGVVVPSLPTDTVLAEADIGPAGGSLVVTEGPHAGVALQVPAGAVAVPTRFSVALDVVNDEVPSIWPVYRFEPRAVDFVFTQVVVTVRAGDSLFPGTATPQLAMFRQLQADSPWDALLPGTVDGPSRTVTVTTRRLGDFLAWDGNLHRLFTQQDRLLDPAVPVRTEDVFGVEVTTGNGSLLLQVGRGSLQSFWNSPSADNVLILHGALGSPLDFLGGDDLVATLAPTARNVVLASYPSARGAALPANALYDKIISRRGPGFGCAIIGHSLGGLIGRYLLERSADDRSRANWQAGDQPLGATVSDLILLGTPSAGAEFASGVVATLLPLLPPNERYYLQAAVDLSEQPGSLTWHLNANYFDNATRYHVVYGDIGGGGDGVVSTASALALPLFPPETATVFPLAHDDLHRLAGSAGVAALIDSLLQAP